MDSSIANSYSRIVPSDFVPLRTSTARPGLIFLVDQSSLSSKTKRLVKMFVRLYQATSTADFTVERLMELRGCGKGTAYEILYWVQNCDNQK